MALTNRGKNVVRFSAGFSLLVVIFAGFSAMSSASDVNVNTSVASQYMKVVVAPGETLWSLASSVAGSGSVSTMVDQIVAANHLASTDVAAGTRLLVPVK